MEIKRNREIGDAKSEGGRGDMCKVVANTDNEVQLGMKDQEQEVTNARPGTEEGKCLFNAGSDKK